MGHPGNWSARKFASVRSQNASEALAELVTAEFRHQGDRNHNFVAMTPCTTFNYLYLTAEAECCGCLRTSPISKATALATTVSHEPWPTTLALLVCRGCGSRPKSIAFHKPHPHGGRDLVGRLVVEVRREP